MSLKNSKTSRKCCENLQPPRTPKEFPRALKSNKIE